MVGNQVSKIKPGFNFRKNGQELVEFAVMLPLLLIILIGVIDLGRVFHASITIANASRAGARYANSYGFEDNSGITLNTLDISLKAQTEAQNSGITLTSVSASCPGGCTRGGPVVVTVTHDFLFLFNTFLGSGITLSHSTEMKIPW